MASDFVRDGIRKYRSAGRRRLLYSLILIAVIFAVCVYSLSVSRLEMTFGQALEAVWNHITGNVPSRTEDYQAWWRDYVIVNDNAPRTICGVCVGIVLAASGAVMQSITRNPLTDPYTIGISSAALFGVTVFITSGFCIVPFLDGDSGKIANAFLFCLVPVFAIVAVSTFKRTTSTMMILIGIAIMYMFNAFTTFLKFNASEEDLQEIYQWGLGTLSFVGWNAVVMLIAASVILLIVMELLADRIDVVALGDKEAVSLGESPVKIRIVCLVMISVATAVAVCYTGTIGFVGLVGPHIARLFVGSGSKALIPTSALIGALMVVGSDCIVRMLPTVLPVGVITALIGSPLFLYFLYKQRKKSVW